MAGMPERFIGDGSRSRRRSTPAPNPESRGMHRSGVLPTAERTNRLPALRRQLLEHLRDSGPTAVVDLPRRWPITRYHVRRLLHRLAAEGLIEIAGGGTPAWYRLARLTGRGADAVQRFGRSETERTVTLSRSA